MSTLDLKRDLRRRLKAVLVELEKPMPADPLLVLVYRPDSTNAAVTTEGCFSANQPTGLWTTTDYDEAEERIRSQNYRYTSVVEYPQYLRTCHANLAELLEWA